MFTQNSSLASLFHVFIKFLCYEQIGGNIFKVSSLLTQKAFSFPSSNSHTYFWEEIQLSGFQNLFGSNYAQLNFFFIPFGKHFHFKPTNFHMDTFVDEVKSILQIMAKILGREDTNVINRAILGMFIFLMNHETIFDIPAFWEKRVNSQLIHISLIGCFKFPFFVTYLFLYTHIEIFMHMGLSIIDPHKNK